MQLLERYDVKYVQFLSVCKYVYVYMYACLCACIYRSNNTHVHITMQIVCISYYIYHYVTCDILLLVLHPAPHSCLCIISGEYYY